MVNIDGAYLSLVAYEVGYDELFLLLGSSMEKDILDHSTYFVHSCVEYVEIL
jgi:hypothetical protein